MIRIFVGDVQGCADELETLYARAVAKYGDDFSLWIAGDLVNRGPDNRRALERVRGLVEAGRAEYVLGNHEIHLIATALGLRDLSPNDSIGDVLDAPDALEWADWLRGRPLAVAGELEGQRFAMVHAASGPDWTLEELVDRAVRAGDALAGDRDAARRFLALSPTEDPRRDDLARLTRCRTATDASWSSLLPATPEQAWHVAWRRHTHDHGLIYGHWAQQGLHVVAGLRGLDTGCVHHGRDHDGFLTAWLPESHPREDGRRPFDVPDDRFWQIPARRRYYYPVPEPAAAG